MNIIGARGGDWRPDRRDIHPLWWLCGIIGAVIFYIAVAAIIGSILNGNGSPFLS
jgi:hypothetical protein